MLKIKHWKNTALLFMNCVRVEHIYVFIVADSSLHRCWIKLIQDMIKFMLLLIPHYNTTHLLCGLLNKITHHFFQHAYFSCTAPKKVTTFLCKIQNLFFSMYYVTVT